MLTTWGPMMVVRNKRSATFWCEISLLPSGLKYSKYDGLKYLKYWKYEELKYLKFYAEDG